MSKLSRVALLPAGKWFGMNFTASATKFNLERGFLRTRLFACVSFDVALLNGLVGF